MKKNILLVIMIVLGVCGYTHSVFATSLIQTTDIMTRLRTLTAADHEIQFTVVNGVGLPGKGETITVSFGTAISNTNTISYEDISLRYGTQGQELSQALYSTRGPNVWGVNINSQTKTLTLTFPSSNGTPITTGQRVIIKIGTSVRDNANQLINGSTTGSHTIGITAGDFDTKTIAIALLINDAVGAGSPVAEQASQQQDGGGASVLLPPAPTPTTSPTPTPTSAEPVPPTPATEEESTPTTPPPAEIPISAEPVSPTPTAQEEPLPPIPPPATTEVIAPTQPPPTSAIVSLGAPASIQIQADKVSSASVINTDTNGQTTGAFAELEKGTVTEDGNITIEPIRITEASNLDSEIRIPSDKDIPDKVFYKINISTKVEKPIRITIKYNPLLLAGVDPLSLKINHWDPEKNKWFPLEDTIIDTSQNTLSAYVIPQTIYAALATVTSRESFKERQKITIKSSIKFIPRNSGISQTDLAFTQKADAEPIRFVNYDFYTSGAHEMMFCIKEKLFLKPVASVSLDFMNKQEKLFYNKTFKCFSGFLTAPIDEGTYPIKLKVIYKDDYTEIISPNLVVTTPLQAFIKPIIRWIIEDVQSSPLAMAGVYGSLILLLLGIWFAVDRRLRKIRMISPILSVSKK